MRIIIDDQRNSGSKKLNENRSSVFVPQGTNYASIKFAFSGFCNHSVLAKDIGRMYSLAGIQEKTGGENNPVICRRQLLKITYLVPPRIDIDSFEHIEPLKAAN